MISMHAASLPSLIAFAVNLYLFLLILLDRNRRSTDTVFLFLILAFMNWNLSEWALFNAHSPEYAALFGRLIWTTASFLGPLFMHFALAFPRRSGLLGRRSFVTALYLPSLVLLAITWSTDALVRGAAPAPWGPNLDIRYGTFLLPAVLYLVLALVFGLFCFYRTWRFSQRKREQLQGKWFFFATLVPILGGAATNLVFPLFGLRVFPLGTSLTAVMSLCIAYGIWEYRLISVTPASTAEMIISMLPGIVLLLDVDQKILYANDRMLETLEYRRDEVIGRHISSLICEKDRKHGLPLQQWDTREHAESFTVGFLDRKGAVVPLSFNGSIISDENDAVGIVIMGFPVHAPFLKPPRPS